MFLRNDHGLEQAGGTATVSFGRAPVPLPELGRFDRWRERARTIDWVPDLGSRIGSLDWWRGAATCAALCAAAIVIAPPITGPIPGATPAPLAGRDRDEARAQAITPLALGADSGRHMAANDLVVPLAEAPERPIEERTATIGRGSLGDMLQRAGVSEHDAQDAVALISGAVSLGELKPGTQVPMTLGRRPDKSVPRPLEILALRARFDEELTLRRVGDALTLTKQAIAIDHTPLRIQGVVGASLYRSARSAGVPVKAVEAAIKALAGKMSIGRIGAHDAYDFTLERKRAATGEVQFGDLQFAGIEHDGRKLQLVRWNDGTWYDASAAQAEKQGMFTMPVPMSRITSAFGMRFHPLLGFTRMHKGIDIGTPWGTPVHAPADGTIVFAGRSGGYGNFVKLAHGGGIETHYGHLSRFATRAGQHVSRGQVIAYSGNSGLSTGPHLHWEVLRGGVAVNPRGFSFSSIATLTGEQLRAFRAKVASLLAVKPGK